MTKNAKWWVWWCAAMLLATASVVAGTVGQAHLMRWIVTP